MIVLQADVSMVLYDPLVIRLRNVVAPPPSPQSPTALLAATQLSGAASANKLAMQAASGLRRAKAREVKTDMESSPEDCWLARRVYESAVCRVCEVMRSPGNL